MAGQKITCTECDASLTVSEAVTPGKKIRCPKCQAIFRIPETAFAEAPAAPKRARRPEPEDDRDDDYDSRPPRRRDRSRDSAGIGVGAVIGIIAASLLLIAGVGFGVWWGVSSWNESERAELAAKEAALAAKAPVNAMNPGRNLFIPPDLANGGVNPLVPQAAAGPQVGKPAPEIEGEDLDGQKFKLSDYRGKVVLLDFWGNW